MESHIKICMRDHTTYIICGPVEGGELYKMSSVMIVEKNVVMNQGTSSALIHYLCIEPDLCQQSIGTSTLKMVFNQPEY